MKYEFWDREVSPERHKTVAGSEAAGIRYTKEKYLKHKCFSISFTIIF